MPVADQVIVELRADLNRYVTDLRRAETEFDSRIRKIEGKNVRMDRAGRSASDSFFQSFQRGLLASFATLGPGLLASKVIDLTAQVADMADFAERAGVATRELQALQHAARATSASTEALNSGLAFFNRQIGQASRGSGDLYEILQANNVALKDGEGNFRSTTELLLDYADLIQRAGSEQERALLIQRAFGRGAEELGTLFADGAEGIRAFMQEAEDIGGIISDEDIQRARELDNEFDKLATTIGTKLKQAAIAAAGAFGDFRADIQDLGRVTSDFLNDPSLASFLDAMLGGGASEALGAGSSAAELNRKFAAGRRQFRPNTGARGADLTLDEITVLPDTGTGGGTKKDFERGTQSLIERTRALREEIAVVGLSNAEAERRRAILELTLDAERQGITVDATRRAQIEALANAYSQQVAILETVLQKQQEIDAAAAQAFDIVKGGFIDAIIEGEKFEDVLKNVVKQLASLALNNTLTNLFAPKAGGSGGGIFSGIFGSIGKLFAGGFQGGGNIPSGKFGLVGERGPEFVRGPAMVSPSSRSEGGVTVVIHQSNDFSGVDPASIAKLDAKIGIAKNEAVREAIAGVAATRAKRPGYLKGA